MKTILIAAYAIVAAIGVTLIKIGLSNALFARDGDSLSIRIGLMACFGLVLYIASFGLWLYILSTSNLVIIFPLATGASFLGVGILATVFLHEKVSVGTIVGMSLILSGIVFLGRKG